MSKIMLKGNILTVLLIYIPLHLTAAGVIYYYENRHLEKSWLEKGANTTVTRAIIEERASEKGITNVSITMSEHSGNRSETNGTKWTYFESVFFVLATHSTMGYGNLALASHEGKLFVILFSWLGISLNSVLHTLLGEVIQSWFSRTRRLKCILYQMLGAVLFILIPALIFMKVEIWSYTESVYYCFVSLATIGYRDYVPGKMPSTSFVGIVYRIFHIIWLISGITYFAKLVETMTNYLREILNEVKLPKPRVQTYNIKRSQSCPNLSKRRDGRPNLTLENERGKGKTLSEEKQERCHQRFLSGRFVGAGRKTMLSRSPPDPEVFPNYFALRHECSVQIDTAETKFNEVTQFSRGKQNLDSQTLGIEDSP